MIESKVCWRMCSNNPSTRTHAMCGECDPSRDTPPTVEELRKRRAPAAVKAAMGCVEASNDLRELETLQGIATREGGEECSLVGMALALAIEVKEASLKHGIETLEDIGRELDE